jgi:alanyl-tRNA synthetase
MTSLNQVRATFLDFFGKNGHEVRPSSSLVPHNDPTLMFTAAGMVQFKNVFTGIEKLPFTRAATSQKCVRAGGKHNDLDNVGYTARHHTFFEMLGNFSFGDYFKEEAIHLAWNLLTKEYGLSAEKLCVTVYHDDDTAWNIWKKLTGFADHKIIRINSSDNFWSAGDTGPCGPCSEIFYDHGDHIAGGPPGSKDQDGDRFVEIWNLVFMQYEQIDAAKRIDLPKPSIDTGMGLERITAVMQGVHDNYEIDLFKNLIADIKSKAGNKGEAAAYKVIADHLRSSCFLMADGVMPSNEGRGYVLRRIMRRAMRYAHQLGCKDPLMYQLVPALVKEMGGQYPELLRAEASITESLKQEEERFKETLDRGLKLLEEETARLGKGQHLPGEAAFKLYDTYGFPLDLTQDILKSQGIGVDTDGFEKAMEGQREMARAAHKGSGDVATSRIWFEMKEQLGNTEFVGYEKDEADCKIFAIVKNGVSVESADAGDEVFIVLDHTPFYGESGGQVGDTGEFSAGGRKIATILDTQKPLEDFIIHKAKLHAPIRLADSVHAAIDSARRNRIRSNHSVTHLLHKALRDKLGAHVTQKGSLVADDRLRFDISHPKAVGAEELAFIETTVNEVVARGGVVECKEMAPDDAIKAGAMALFGEKYGDRVRVLSMGKNHDGSTYSVELCGGTHVRDTSDIQIFKITSEGSVAAGIRRIEATTGENVRRFWLERLADLTEKAAALYRDHLRLHGELADAQSKLSSQATEKPLPAINGDAKAIEGAPLSSLTALASSECSKLEGYQTALQEENRKLTKLLAEAKKQLALGSDTAAKPETIGAYQFIGKAFDGLDPKELRDMANGYLKQADVVVVATNVEGKASVVVGVNKPHSDKISAVTLVQAAVAELGGKGGGGKPEIAQGGGPDVAKIDAAVTKIKSILA